MIFTIMLLSHIDKINKYKYIAIRKDKSRLIIKSMKDSDWVQWCIDAKWRP